MKLIATCRTSIGSEGQLDEKSDAAPIAQPDAGTLHLTNDVDPRSVSLAGVHRIDLHFPKFTDGRAFSQAYMLRRRMGFTGEIRATGDVLVDQLVQMQRSGFDAAELRADQPLELAQQQFVRYAGFYQGDAVTTQPRFQRSAA